MARFKWRRNFLFQAASGVMLEDAVFTVLRRTGALKNDWRIRHMNGGKKPTVQRIVTGISNLGQKQWGIS